MRQASSLLIVVLLLVVGAGWYFFQGSSGSLTPVGGIAPPLASSLSPEATRSAPELDEGPERPATERTEVETKDMAMSLGADTAELVAAASQGPRVRGRVVDTAGNPLAGARVVVAGGDPLPIDFAGDSNSGFAKRWRTTSRKDGTFELQGPEPGGLRLGVWLAEYAPLERLNLVLPAGAGADFGDLPLDASVILTGRVTVIGGGPVADAKIFAEKVNDNSPFSFAIPGLPRTPVAVSAADGSFRVDMLSAGPWKLRVDSDVHPERTFEGRTDRPGDLRSGLAFVLEQGAAIRGRVADYPEGGLEGLVVRASPKGQGRSFGPMQNWREASVSPGGSFSVEGCEKDKEYILQARVAEERAAMPWGGETKTRTQEVSARPGHSGIVLNWTGTTGVRFQVVQPSGQPVEKFTVRYGQGFLRDYALEGEPVRFHPAGLVSLEELNSGGFGRGQDFKVLVEAAGFESFEKVVELASGKIVDAGAFQLTAAPIVTVRVFDDLTGEPVEGANVSLSVGGNDQTSFDIGGGTRFFDSENAGKQRSVKSGADGLASLSSFEGQIGKLKVTDENHTDWSLDSFSMPSGESQTIEARLGRGGSVEVTVLDAYGSPRPGAQVETRVKGSGNESNGMGGFGRARMFGGSPEGVTDQSGLASFHHLTPGEHEFRLTETANMGGAMVIFSGGTDEPEELWASVLVTEGGLSALELREEPRSSLSGIVREGGEALAGASLRLDSKDSNDQLGGMGRMMVFGGSGGKGTGTTDGRGAFVLEGVEPGTYVLTVNHATRTMAYEVDVVLTTGENRKDLDLPIAVVEGRVTDGDGRPLPGVKVRIESSTRNPFMRAMMFRSDDGSSEIAVGSEDADPSTTDADGRYRLRGVAVGKDIKVVATRDGSSPAESELFQVSDGQIRRGVDLVLQSAGRIKATILGLENQQFAIVTARYLDGEGVDPVTEFANDGETTLRGLRTGQWEVSIQMVGEGPFNSDQQGPEIPPQTILVTSDETQPVIFEL